MKSAILVLVALSLVVVAGGAVAPGACVGLTGGAGLVAQVASDPSPDAVIALVPGAVDIDPSC